jgi:hypothetical protein
MFGMLDYRAHKLYLILFGIPWFILRWATLIGLPFAYYLLGLELAHNRLLQILISMGALFIGELIWLVITTYIDKLSMFLFGLIIDVIPADGRTKEEAAMVVKGGDPVIGTLTLNKKHPSEWTDEDIAFSKKGFFNFFFQEKINDRIQRVRDHYQANPNLAVGYELDRFMEANNLNIGWLERIITNVSFRGMIISYGLMLYLLLFNPFGR